ncbi:MAG: hypothetical protein LC723_13150 [Actinobacteria bacterium]|nr:hypothetical protein [Actinomycetota bacterium]
MFEIDGDNEHRFSEVVGVLQRVEGPADAPVYLVVKRDGSTVLVPADRVVALKILPSSRAPVTRLPSHDN